jgi:hypothetical protein
MPLRCPLTPGERIKQWSPLEKYHRAWSTANAILYAYRSAVTEDTSRTEKNELGTRIGGSRAFFIFLEMVRNNKSQKKNQL